MLPNLSAGAFLGVRRPYLYGIVCLSSQAELRSRGLCECLFWTLLDRAAAHDTDTSAAKILYPAHQRARAVRHGTSRRRAGRRLPGVTGFAGPSLSTYAR